MKRGNKRSCIKCEIGTHNVVVTGSLLCDDCFRETVSRLRATYGRRAKRQTRRGIARRIQSKALELGNELTLASVEFRLKDGWDESEIIKIPQGGRRNETVGVS